MKGPKQLNPKWPSVLETLRIRVQELEQDRDTAHAQLKTVEQECNDEREEHERVQLRLRIALQKVTGERDTANAKLKKVEQERDNRVYSGVAAVISIGVIVITFGNLLL